VRIRYTHQVHIDLLRPRLGGTCACLIVLHGQYGKLSEGRNLRRNRQVCVVAESGTRDAEVRGVIIQGHVEFLEHAAGSQPVVTRLLRKYDPQPAALWGRTSMPPSRVVFRIVPEKAYSWGLD
jgi:hypothetical protein